MLLLALALSSPAQAATHITVGSLTVDGLNVRELDCTLEGGGLLAQIVVVGGLATQRQALDACAPEGAAFKVGWTWAEGVTSKVTVDDGPDKARSCVAAAVGAVEAPMAGRCSAVLLVGDLSAAEAALAPAPAPAAAPQEPPATP